MIPLAIAWELAKTGPTAADSGFGATPNKAAVPWTAPVAPALNAWSTSKLYSAMLDGLGCWALLPG